MCSLASLDVHQRVIESLRHARVTDLKELVLAAKADLQKSTKLTQKDVISAKIAAAKLLFSDQGFTAHQLLSAGRTRKLATGCAAIDELLRGGFINHGVTEVTGESASGKTQLCLQLAIQVQLQQQAEASGCDGGGNTSTSRQELRPGAVYICTEGAFPSRRLQQIIECSASDHPGIESQQALGDRVFVQHISDQEQLVRCLASELPALQQRTSIGLVVIDSIAALFRGGQYELQRGGEAVERSRDMARLAAALHRLADDRRLHVVCVNQVTADVQRGTGRPMPALGLTWANFVTTRLQLLRSSSTGDVVCRQAELSFAPHLPTGRCEFSISAAGLVDIGSGAP